MNRYGFIGVGNMGGALASALVKSVAGDCVYLTDLNRRRALSLAEELNCNTNDIAALVEECDVIFIGVKPQGLSSLIDEIRGEIEKRGTKPVLVSMLAGVSMEKIVKLLGFDCPVIRIMPNMPVAVGKGMILLSHNDLVSDEMLATFRDAMKAAGEIDVLPEKLIDAGSAVSGCGPAFVYLFIEALADGGVSCGLPRDKALLYASQTVLGAAETVLNSDSHPAELKDRVCSPGGTTIAGVQALENGAFRASAINAVKAAYEKTLIIGK